MERETSEIQNEMVTPDIHNHSHNQVNYNAIIQIFKDAQ